MNGKRTEKVQRIAASGRSSATRTIPVEAPVSIEVNGIAYAVMMATPTDLEAFGLGFSLSERIVKHTDDVREVSVAETDLGWIVRIWLHDAQAGVDAARSRVRIADSSCGICGIENLEHFSNPLPPVSAAIAVDDDAIFRALERLRDFQPLNAATGGAHAAAFCTPTGEIVAVMEDVGRHNALDKLIGNLAQKKINLKTGFFLLSARCSYELVEKTVIAGCPLLVTVSIATSMAVDRARDAGLELIALARSDEMLGFQTRNGN